MCIRDRSITARLSPTNEKFLPNDEFYSPIRRPAQSLRQLGRIYCSETRIGFSIHTEDKAITKTPPQEDAEPDYEDEPGRPLSQSSPGLAATVFPAGAAQGVGERSTARRLLRLARRRRRHRRAR